MSSNSVNRPRRLAAGGTIGITAPASTPDPIKLERGVRYLESLGYRVKVGETCHAQEHYLAGPDPMRAAELMRMFTDPAVDAIFCARGGYGTLHLLESLDYEVIGRSGKLFVGFSDITALEWAFWKHARFVTISGGMAATDFAWEERDPDFEAGFWEVIGSGHLRLPLPPIDRPAGTARGVLLPGTASVAAKLFGSRHMPDFAGSIPVLEDVDEPKHKVEGYLRQFLLAGAFDRVAAVVLGQFTPSASESYPVVPDLHTILDRVFADVPAPVFRGLNYGHIRPKLTVPTGTEAVVSWGPESVLTTVASIYAD